MSDLTKRIDAAVATAEKPSPLLENCPESEDIVSGLGGVIDTLRGLIPKATSPDCAKSLNDLMVSAETLAATFAQSHGIGDEAML